MIYLIALIIILLIAILFLLFYAPKPKPQRTAVPKASALPAADEQELSFEDITEIPESAVNDHEPELELTLDFADVELPETVAVEAQQLPAGETPASYLAEEIPFILEDETATPRKDGAEMAPALAGFDGDAALVHEETPDDLAERLDFFFASDEDTGEGLVVEEVAGQEAGLPEASAVDEMPGEAAREARTGVTLAEYEAGLRQLEEKLRQELDRVIVGRETGKLALLESKLTAVCGSLAALPAALAQRNQLYAEIEQVLAEIIEALPGFQVTTVRRHLHSGEEEVVRALLAEAAGQLPEDSSLPARIYFLSGRLAEEQAEYAAAEELYGRASAADEHNPEFCFAAGRMARMLGNDEYARLRLEHLLNAAGQAGGNSQLLAKARHELARAYVRTERKDRAEPLLQQALAGLEGCLGANHPALGPVLHDLAALFEGSGRYEEAAPLYQRALEVTEQGLGSEHPQLAVTLNRLAGLYEEMEQADLAEPLYEKVLVIKNRVLGSSHPDIGIILNHLANLVKQRGQYAQAEPMFRRSLEIAEKALGSDHPNLAVILNNMAELYSEMGNEEQARYYEERAFALFELPGGGGDFVEIEKDHEIDLDDEKEQIIAGS